MTMNLNSHKDKNMVDRESLTRMMTGFQPACVLGAAAELDLFAHLNHHPKSVEQVASELDADPRALVVLLDALAALELIAKDADQYTISTAVKKLLDADEPGTMLPMMRHWMNCLRSWSRLAEVVRSGSPAPREPSIRGAEADRAAFVAGMHSINIDRAGPLVRKLFEEAGLEPFTHLLDVGGASGTWTLAFLDALPQSRATIFDLPDAIDQAKARIGTSDHAERIALVAGDFYQNDLPEGADFGWLSAIIHQNSREQNRALFDKVFAALRPGGRIAIRDVVMEPSRTAPVHGALFAVNMLVNTPGGGTYTLEEIAADLTSAGFRDIYQALPSEQMEAVVVGTKPE